MTSFIKKLITPHIKDLGGFQVRRSLPQQDFMMVGPFIFFDHLGPATFAPGKGIDVRPHPHINLATVTYLFEGAVMHRDSLGTVQEIRPGAVNWMTAGKGIVHSERSPDHFRHQTATLHALQTWIALPEAAEETEPTFHHYSADDLPLWVNNGATIKLITGKVGSRVSPVQVHSPTLYLDIQFSAGSTFVLAADYSERAVYALGNGLSLNGLNSDGSNNTDALAPCQMTVLEAGEPVTLAAEQAVRCVVIGGEPLGQRLKWWNFVASRKARLEEAKADWKAQRFDKVPDESEFIPLPETAEEFSAPGI
ncbi:MAG: pirin family protein [Cyanobacteria bacterium P01_D01_bin.105]